MLRIMFHQCFINTSNYTSYQTDSDMELCIELESARDCNHTKSTWCDSLCLLNKLWQQNTIKTSINITTRIKAAMTTNADEEKQSVMLCFSWTNICSEAEWGGGGGGDVATVLPWSPTGSTTASHLWSELFICQSALAARDLWFWLCLSGFESSTEIISAALCLWLLFHWLWVRPNIHVPHATVRQGTHNKQSAFKTDTKCVITFNYPYLQLLHIRLHWNHFKCHFVKIAAHSEWESRLDD